MVGGIPLADLGAGEPQSVQMRVVKGSMVFLGGPKQVFIKIVHLIVGETTFVAKLVLIIQLNRHQGRIPSEYKREP